MITRYTIALSRKDSAEKIPQSISYALYSELARMIETEYGEKLHEQGFTPLSQYISFRQDGTVLWNVSLLNSETAEVFSPLLENTSHYTIFDQNLQLDVSEIKVESVVYSDILQRAAVVLPSRTSLEFVSPTSFKSAGKYMIFPTTDLILRNLVKSWNSACPSYPLADEDSLALLCSGVDIHSYQMSSAYFRLKGTAIPAFRGKLHLSTKLSQPMYTILQILLQFSEYSGIGIKTALGMGGVRRLTDA